MKEKILAHFKETFFEVTEKAAALSEAANKHHMKLMCLVAIFYKIALDVHYIVAVSYQHSYAGLQLRTDSLRYVLSWILYIVVFVCLPKIENELASFCLNLQFVVIYAPMLTYFALNTQSYIYIIGVSAAFLVQTWILRPSATLKIRPTPSLPGLQSRATVLSLIFIFANILILLIWNGFYGVQAFDFHFLYSIRENATYPPLIPYFVSWIFKILIPFFFVFLLEKKKIWSAAILFLCDIVLYMILGNKFIYLSLAVLLGVYIIFKLRHSIKLLYSAFTILCTIISSLYCIEKLSASTISSQPIGRITSLWGSRFLFIPAQHKFLFYDCFSKYPKLFYSEGQIGNILNLFHPYNGSVGQVIFAYQFNGRFMSSNSNTGYWGDSFAQSGWLGVFAASILLALIIKFLTKCARNSSSLALPFITSMSIQMIILNDSSFITNLLTGGMFLLLLFALIYTDNSNKHLLRGNIK